MPEIMEDTQMNASRNIVKPGKEIYREISALIPLVIQSPHPLLH